MRTKVIVVEQNETAGRKGLPDFRTGMREIAALLRHENSPFPAETGERLVKTGAPKSVRSQRGQAMTEYLFLVVLCGLVCIPVVKLLPEAVRGYIRPFYYCISRPIP